MSTPDVIPMVAGLGPPEIVIILVILLLLFGAKKLPELARGSGRALRIFKAETKGLLDDDDETKTGETKTDEQKQLDAQRSTAPATPVAPSTPVVEVHQVETPTDQPRTDNDR